MPKFKPKSTLSSLKDLGKVAKEILPKEKRPRIKIQKETPKVVERVNYTPSARRSWSFEDIYRRLNNNQTIKLLDDPNDFKFGRILKKIK